MFFSILLMLFISQQSFAQFSLSGEIRPRYEFRNGFKSLSSINDDFGSFTDQRTRINFDYSNESYIFKIVFQDIRTWGSQSQLVSNDGALTSVHEAWGEALLSERFSLKLGRQEIIYDDHRIFGSVGWAQQARSHDAAIVKYKTDDFKLDFGYAFNQNGPSTTNTFYTVPRSYKAFQYFWAHKKIGDFKASFLFLNNGVQQDTPTDYSTNYSQTYGTRLAYVKNALSASLNYYRQTDSGGNKLSANLLGLDLAYKVTEKTSLFVGYELISGNDQTKPDSKNKAFNPLYGTNHKFNGFMDYFYVGNHANNVGLNDLYFGSKTSISKVKIYGAFHMFSSNGNVQEGTSANTMSNGLGSELDLTFSFNLNEGVAFQCGYSQMFATDTMEAIKGGDKNATSNWAFMMITMKPIFFTSNKEN